MLRRSSISLSGAVNAFIACFGVGSYRATTPRMASDRQIEPPRTPDLLPSSDVTVPEPWKLGALRNAKCEREDP